MMPLSRMDAMQQQAMASKQLATLQRQKQRLAAALIRITNGSFGGCCECGEEIAAARLASDPGVPLTMVRKRTYTNTRILVMY